MIRRFKSIKSIKTAWFCLRTVEYGSIMISIFSLEFKSFNRIFGKPDESLGRKAKGPVKWQPVAENDMHCL